MMDLILSAPGGSNADMRRVLLRWVVVFAIAVMLCGHVTELFDCWDQTLTTGRDADYSIVFLAACAGVVFLVANYLTSLLGCSRANESSPVLQVFSAFRTIVSDTCDPGLSPPPNLPLRV
jgi:hypothetical protein